MSERIKHLHSQYLKKDKILLTYASFYGRNLRPRCPMEENVLQINYEKKEKKDDPKGEEKKHKKVKPQA